MAPKKRTSPPAWDCGVAMLCCADENEEELVLGRELELVVVEVPMKEGGETDSPEVELVLKRCVATAGNPPIG